MVPQAGQTWVDVGGVGVQGLMRSSCDRLGEGLS